MPETAPHPDDLTLLAEMLSARLCAGLTMTNVAERMGVSASLLDGIEQGLRDGSYSPSLDLLRRYATACGKKLVISFA
jgi:transcriptional regulator with XRE-family HTH domain